MKRVLAITVCIFVLIMFTPGCTMAKSIGKAEDVTTEYYTAMQQEDYDVALELYGDRFFEETDRDSWKESLGVITKKLGNLEEYKLKSWGVNVQAGAKNSGTYYTLTYEVKYSKYPAVEKLTLYRKGKDDPIVIVGHNISSEGLLKD